MVNTSDIVVQFPRYVRHRLFYDENIGAITLCILLIQILHMICWITVVILFTARAISVVSRPSVRNVDVPWAYRLD